MAAKLKKEKILIIEGNVTLGEKISSALKAEGYSVFVVNDGIKGFDAITDVSPELIIIDLVIPGMDAYEILIKKHADTMLKKIPVFILSTQGTPINMRQVPEGSVTDFIVSLEPNPTDIATPINNFFGHKETEVTPTPNSAKGKKILWVEDDKLIGSILSKKFISSGFELFHANNGDEAFAHLKNNTPDMAVLDLMLPGMDGFEILQKMRMEPALKKIPIIILSNLSKPSDFEKAKVLGATKFMVKASSSLDAIVAEVKALV